ncbi:MAG: FAA hydrolase family protein [Thermoleophilia bacterium]|nr:FAA hydrolase family protein [Thermoleophilia bacterium]
MHGDPPRVLERHLCPIPVGLPARHRPIQASGHNSVQRVLRGTTTSPCKRVWHHRRAGLGLCVDVLGGLVKLVTFQAGPLRAVGAVDGSRVIDLQRAYALRLEGEGDVRGTEIAAVRIPNDMSRFVAGLEPSWRAAEQALEWGRDVDAVAYDLEEVRLLAPLVPSTILNSGQNYWDHREEKPPVDQKEPEFFLKSPLAVIGPGDPIVYDQAVTRKLDYEVELAVVIGKPGRHIPRERALEHVFGYTVANDVTARDRQAVPHPSGGWQYALGPGKNFDSAAPLGPWIVTADEIPDPQDLALRTYVNGELRQNNTTAKMIWDVAALVAFFSTFYTLQPGVVIETGTPGGTAWATDPEIGGRAYEREDVRRAGYLKPGDVVRVEIDGIGVLTNPVVGAE